MKNIFAALSFVAALALVAVPASADITTLVDEQFDYPNGSLTSNPDWSTHSGTGGQIEVLDGAACIDMSGGDSEDVNISFAEQDAGCITYSFSLSVADLGAPFSGSDNEYFAHFRTSGFLARLDLVSPTGTGDFTLGLASFGSSADVVWGSDFSYGESIDVAVTYDIDEDQASFSVNGGAALFGADGSFSNTVSSFSFRQSAASNDEQIKVDNLLVIHDDKIKGVPEPTSAAVLAVVGLAGMARRRR